MEPSRNENTIDIELLKTMYMYHLDTGLSMSLVKIYDIS